jgi:hypothetical protein
MCNHKVCAEVNFGRCLIAMPRCEHVGCDLEAIGTHGICIFVEWTCAIHNTDNYFTPIERTNFFVMKQEMLDREIELNLI